MSEKDAVPDSDQTLGLAPEKAQALLDSRAKRLSRTVASAAEAQDRIELLMFKLGTDNYAVDPRLIHHVQLVPEMTPLPHMESHIAGILNLRGTVLMVAHLRPLLGLPVKPLDESTRLLVVGETEPELGFLVDEVVGVVEMARKEFVEGGTIQPAFAPEFLQGVFRSGCVVLNLSNLLKDSRLIVDNA
jgi:purine-binding chemotaxis protein CheW